jgi:hypothetical protein
MTVGFQAFNDSGITQIDGTYKNLSLKTKGTATTTTAATDFSTVTFTVSGVVGEPVIAVSAPGGAVGHVGNLSGGVATVVIVALGPVGTSVNWWMFTDPGNAAAYGLAIYDDSGAMVFNAAERYMRYAGQVGLVAIGTNPSVTLPSGKTYAAYQATPAARGVVYSDIPGPAGTPWYLDTIRGVPKISGNVVSSVYAQIGHNGPFYAPGVPSAYSFSGTAFVLDVTHY